MTTLLKHLGNPRRWFAAPVRTEAPVSIGFRVTVIAVTLAWCVGTGWIVATTNIVGSPDEAANAYFISHLARTGEYRVQTGLSASALSFLHPRSIAVQGQFLAPGSFLGLVQAGAGVAKVFGSGAERFLTPLLSLGGLVAMFFVFRRFWGRWWSLLGVVLIALHPAFFEFATLPYLHNGAFVAGLMMAGWALLRLLERPSWQSSTLFGLLFGVALFFRPVEALWSVPVVMVLLIARRLWVPLLAAGLLTVIVQLPWFLANQHIFGSWLSSGYSPSGIFTDVESAAVVTQPAKLLLTPAGGHWSWHWLSSFWWYYILLLPVWSALAVVALGRYFYRKFVSLSKSVKLTLICLLGFFPFVYYGSWDLYPSTPASVNGALASYVRYWVVLYVAMAPGVIIGLQAVSRRWLVWVVSGAMLVSQLIILWSQPVAGVRAKFEANKKYSEERTVVLSATEPNAIIIAGHHDKYFQDQRLATFRLPQSESEWVIFTSIVAERPTYLYAAFGQYALEDIQATLERYNLQLAPRVTIGRDVLFTVLPTS